MEFSEEGGDLEKNSPAVMSKSSLPRSLQRRSSQANFTSTRRFRVVFSLVVTTTLLLSTLYLYTDRPLPHLSLSSYRDDGYPNLELDPKRALDVTHLESQPLSKLNPKPRPRLHLWSYVAETFGADGWRWSATQRAKGYKRPSWGGMSQQGPKAHVRSNLKEGKLYLSTFPEAGFNNQVIETANLIAVALRTNRIPILAPFVPDHYHLQHEESFVSVSEIFDFTDFIAQYDVPVIDLMELKVGDEDWISIDDRHRSIVYDGEYPQFKEDGQTPLVPGDIIQAEQPEFDRLQCWNTFLAVQESQGGHIGTLWPMVMEHTPLPLSAYVDKPRDQNQIFEISLTRTADAISSYSKLSDVLPEDSVLRLESLGREPSRMSPDDPFGCLSRMYFPHLHPETEDVRDDWRNGVGAWEEVGKYLKFQSGLVRLADDLLRNLMGIEAGRKVPPYMAVHIRRTDFADEYRNASQRHWAHSAWRLLHETKEQHDLDVRRIVFTTDEQDEEWLKELKDLGWIYVDHKKARTGDRLGWWFPTVLDSVILSSASVFMGVPSSTMSILPYRRVLEWGEGVARFVPDPRTTVIPADWEWAEDW